MKQEGNEWSDSNHPFQDDTYGNTDTFLEVQATTYLDQF